MRKSPSQSHKISVEIEQGDKKTELRVEGKSVVSTKMVITTITLAVLIGLTVLAQVSTIGKVVFDVIKKFFNI